VSSMQTRNLSLKVENCSCGHMWFRYLEMSSAMTQKETCVSCVNLLLKCQLPRCRTYEPNRVVFAYSSLHWTQQWRDANLKAIDPACRCNIFIQNLACHFRNHHLAWGRPPRDSACVPCSAFFLHFPLRTFVFRHWRSDTIVGSANHGLSCAGQNVTVRFHPVSPVKNIWTSVILLQIMTRNFQT
jgi:hypothetical protein